MNVIDIVILVLLALAVFKGLKDGLMRQVGGITGLFLGIILAGRFSAMLSGWLHRVAPSISESVVKVLSFIIIIVVVCICVVLISRLLEKVIKISTLGWINRLLGVLLSVFAVVLVIGVIISVIEYVNTEWFILVSPQRLADSKGVQIISSVTDALFPYIRKLFYS
ncbi:MAG TPA: CvpA family protein [Candidatus Coprenecus stercorigallinarum]|nr:CvpA family protein [Candidatus Coprenecus stercorigallinarum]